MNWRLLKDSFVDIVLGGLVDDELWRGLREGAFAVLVLVVRLLLLALAPVSVPLIAWMIVHDRRRRAEQDAETRARLRRGLHQNGPGA